MCKNNRFFSKNKLLKITPDLKLKGRKMPIKNKIGV